MSTSETSLSTYKNSYSENVDQYLKNINNKKTEDKKYHAVTKMSTDLIDMIEK